MLLPLELLSEYRIQHCAIRPLYVTSSYLTWIFCRGVSGFAIDCPCVVFVFWHMQLYMSWYIISFSALSLLHKYCSLFFKYVCTNIFLRCSLYTFYMDSPFGNNFHIKLQSAVTHLSGSFGDGLVKSSLTYGHRWVNTYHKIIKEIFVYIFPNPI